MSVFSVADWSKLIEKSRFDIRDQLIGSSLIGGRLHPDQRKTELVQDCFVASPKICPAFAGKTQTVWGGVVACIPETPATRSVLLLNNCSKMLVRHACEQPLQARFWVVLTAKPDIGPPAGNRLQMSSDSVIDDVAITWLILAQVDDLVVHSTQVDACPCDGRLELFGEPFCFESKIERR